MANVDTTSEVGAMVGERREEILAIAARHHGRRVRISGSVARGQATPDSDIDFLVDFEDGSPSSTFTASARSSPSCSAEGLMSCRPAGSDHETRRSSRRPSICE